MKSKFTLIIIFIAPVFAFTQNWFKVHNKDSAFPPSELIAYRYCNEDEIDDYKQQIKASLGIYGEEIGLYLEFHLPTYCHLPNNGKIEKGSIIEIEFENDTLNLVSDISNGFDRKNDDTGYVSHAVYILPIDVMETILNDKITFLTINFGQSPNPMPFDFTNKAVLPYLLKTLLNRANK